MYLQSKFPNLDQEQHFKRFNISLALLEDESQWVSLEFNSQFLKAIESLINLSEDSIKIGALGASKEGSGAALYYTAKHFLSLEEIYSTLPKITGLFNAVMQVVTLEKEPGFLRLAFFPKTAGLTESEVQHLDSAFLQMVRNTVGYYSAIPTAKGLPFAKVGVLQEFTSRSGNRGYSVDLEYFSISKFQTRIWERLAIVSVFLAATISNLFFDWQLIWSIGFCGFVFGTFLLAKIIWKLRGVNQVVRSLQSSLFETEKQAREIFEISVAQQKFVPSETLNFLKYDDLRQVRIGDSKEEVLSVMFIDIYGFSKMCENFTPKDVLAFLNSFYDRVAPIIRQNSGVVNKYLGDGLMALFRDPGTAIQSAKEIHHAVMKYNLTERLPNRGMIRIGIGICHGSVVFAPIGEKNRLELTAISDTVNIASRLESECRRLAADILFAFNGVAESNALPTDEVVFHEPFLVKGKANPVQAIEILVEPLSEEEVQKIEFGHEILSDQRQRYREKKKIPRAS